MNLDQYITIDPIPIYKFYNAKTDWQKQNIDNGLEIYRSLLISYILDKYQYYEGNNLYQIAHDDFNKNVGKPTIYGSTNRYSLVQAILETEPKYELIKGSNYTQKVSFVKLNFDLQKILDAQDIETLMIKLYGEVDITDENKVDLTPIDIKSLTAYIKGNEALSYQNDKLKEYNQQAKLILAIAKYTGGVLPQIINESPFGRRYYKGQSLQSASKIVRAASLGDHYEYDLNAAVYAIKLNFCSELTEQKFTYTSEYIEGGGKFKNSIRKRLAKHCFDIKENDKYFDSRVDIIKQAITAIGFGALKTSHGFYDKNNDWTPTSLYDIFCFTGSNGKSRIAHQKTIDNVKYESVDLFLNDSWMKEFIKEQQTMSKLITDYLIENKEVTKETHQFLVDGRNSINRNKLMAYMFQSIERSIMDYTSEIIKSQNINVLLRVHDAVFTDRKVNLSELHLAIIERFINPKLTNWLGSQIIIFDEKQSNGYSFDDEILAHKERIRCEELRAGGTSPGVKKLTYKHVSYDDSSPYNDSCDYGQSEYDPDNDSYVEAMTHAERREHYRILGYNPNKDDIPEDIRRLL
jgi:hypothetical protein